MGIWPYSNEFYGRVDESQAIKAIREGIENGINLIDTAPTYGLNEDAEKVVGKAIKGYHDKVIIATKCGVYRDGSDYVKYLKPARIRKQLERSLLNLGVDFIDLYQIHWPDPNTPLEESVN